jgi:hypothetical protein
MPLFIDDGFTLTATIPDRPGFHPAVEVVYRPALAKVRHEYHAAVKTGDPAKLEEFEAAAVARHVVTLAGDPGPDKARAARLHPLVRGALLDLILSFAPGAVPPDAALGN